MSNHGKPEMTFADLIATFYDTSDLGVLNALVGRPVTGLTSPAAVSEIAYIGGGYNKGPRTWLINVETQIDGHHYKLYIRKQRHVARHRVRNTATGFHAGPPEFMSVNIIGGPGEGEAYHMIHTEIGELTPLDELKDHYSPLEMVILQPVAHRQSWKVGKPARRIVGMLREALANFRFADATAAA